MYSGEAIIRRQERMAAGQTAIRELRQEVAELLLPRMAKFHCLGQFGQNTQSLVASVFDEYGQQKFEEAVSIAMGLSNPSGQIWQRWTLGDEDLMKLQHVRLWVESKNRLLQKLRSDPKSGFTDNLGEGWASLLAFAMQSSWVDVRRDIMGRPAGFSYQSEFIGGIFIEENAEGLPIRTHNKFMLTARQAWDKWGDESPAVVKRHIGKANGAGDNEQVEFIHAIYPNHEYDPDRIDHLGKPWRGCFVAVEGKELFKEGGYIANPRNVSRFSKGLNGPYGHCAAFQVLPSVRQCQVMMVDLIETAEQKAGPTMLAHDDMLDYGIRYAPREVIMGGLGARYEERIKAMFNPADNGEGWQLLELMHSYIDRAFYAHLLQINQDLKSHVTDQQLFERKADAGVLLTPLARQENEWFSPMLDRELALMDELGLMDDEPGEVREARDAGMGIEAIYDNGVTRSQGAAGVGALLDMERFFASTFQNDPETYQTYKQYYPFEKRLKYVADNTAVPVSIMSTEEERAAIKAQHDQQNQEQQFLAAVPDLAKASKDLSGAVPQNVA
ncbi:portal protein [Novosphingobium sp. FKTRR1]|uniref:portal protein n=1 Tax=Novosphingobium sp. FKTRR1 TaxID=2879118 RepID=UPI001CF0816C|nr:portal protein [Novosphingobium sp. FKTRR1]